MIQYGYSQAKPVVIMNHLCIIPLSRVGQVKKCSGLVMGSSIHVELLSSSPASLLSRIKRETHAVLCTNVY